MYVCVESNARVERVIGFSFVHPWQSYEQEWSLRPLLFCRITSEMCVPSGKPANILAMALYGLLMPFVYKWLWQMRSHEFPEPVASAPLWSKHDWEDEVGEIVFLVRK